MEQDNPQDLKISAAARREERGGGDGPDDDSIRGATWKRPKKGKGKERTLALDLLGCRKGGSGPNW